VKEIQIEVPSFGHLNLFSEEVDLPQIKPKSVHNKNEFFNELPKNLDYEGLTQQGWITREEAQKVQGRSVYEYWEKNMGANLRNMLIEKQKILEQEKHQLKELRKQANINRRH
jgi:hypothetical protein